MRLGLLTSHPIQYHAPWFRALAARCDLRVFYAHQATAQQQSDAGFGQAFDWDLDLLDGYDYTFLDNRAANPTSEAGHFFGCDTPEIKRYIRDGDFDAFVVTGWYLKSFWQAVHGCWQAGVPVLVRGDSQLQTPRSPARRLLKEVGYRVLLRTFDGFLSVGQRFDEYLAHYGVPRRRVFRVPHCVDNDRFAEQARIAHQQGRPSQIRAEYGIAPEATVLLFAGKFIDKKRPRDLVRALARLGERHPVEGLFVGAGPLGAALRREAARLDAPVHFAGFQNQTALPAYYAAADALVLPSDGGETWGLVANEAMACGLPAIVSEAAGCAPDLIDPGVTGFTYPVGDADQLAVCMRQLVSMRRAGHDFRPAVEAKIANYTIDAAAQKTVDAARTLHQRQSA